jgi:hypothetical protein
MVSYILLLRVLLRLSADKAGMGVCATHCGTRFGCIVSRGLGHPFNVLCIMNAVKPYRIALPRSRGS